MPYKPKFKENTDNNWQLQDAKARFSELFRAAISNGPQRVSRQHGGEVIIINAEEFDALTAKKRSPKSLVKFFADSPLREIDLDRVVDYGRSVKL